MVMGVLPGKPFTLDNYLSATVDSVCDEGFPQIFGINPKSVESIVPQYLGQQSIRKRYTQLRRAARR